MGATATRTKAGTRAKGRIGRKRKGEPDAVDRFVDKVRTAEHFQWAGRFAVIAISDPGWQPAHPLDIPRNRMSAEFITELTYENEPLFHTRCQAIARCAYDNKQRLKRNQDPGDFWNMVIELLPTFNFWIVIEDPKDIDDSDGKLTAFDLRFRVVEATDEERQKYALRKRA